MVAQGGSTITQQLVKNTLIDNPKRDLQRKVREAVLAMRLEEIYTKDEILERYLNTVYFGRDAYGIRAASERYFNEQPIDLTIPQAAMLAGMISAPSAYDPILHPVAAHQRRHEVLLAMRETGVIASAKVGAFDRLPAAQAGVQPGRDDRPDELLRLRGRPAAARRPAHGSRRADPPQPHLPRRPAHHDHVRPDPSEVRRGRGEVDDCRGGEPAEHPGHRRARRDRQLQRRGARHGERQRRRERSRAFLKQQFNYATGANRQVGSAFKVFTLATALENGYSPNDTIDGSRCTIPAALTTDAKPYSPGGETIGVITLRTAITNSINCAFVRLIVALGGDPNDLDARRVPTARRRDRRR